MSFENSGDFMTATEIEDRYGIDLVTAETVRSGFIETTRHMYRTLGRSAFSNVVRDLLDFAVCVHLPREEGTEMVAITEGCTHFAFTHPHMANLVLDEWGLDNLGPGDTIICNDPWRGSIHMPDVNLFRPVFWEGEPLFILSDASHLVDIGGPVPGGFNNQALDVFSEGLRIPPSLITSNDKPVRSMINLILENTRTPQHNLGDLRALFGTMKVGEGRIIRMLERYGRDAVVAGARYTLDLAERRVKSVIAGIPDGVYEAEEWIDDDGLGSEPIKIKATGRVAGSHVEIDFSGTERQSIGSLGSCWEETNRVLLGPKMILDPNHPMNAGLFRAFHVVAPSGAVLMSLPPTSNSQHAEVGAKVATVSLRLFSQMMPERGVASDGANSHSYILGGIDQRPGREGQPIGSIVAQGLGWGGTAGGDGISFCTSPLYGISSSIIELMERDAPILLRSTNAQIDAAGAGEYRSGYGNTVLLECSHGELVVSMLLDSGRMPRWAAAGGGEGMTSFIFKVRRDENGRFPQLQGLIPLDHLTPLSGLFDRGGRPDSQDGEWGLGCEYMTNKLTNYTLKAGEALFAITAGGGGYGDPLIRDPELVRLDVWNELLSPQGAERMYGVVVTPKAATVDQDSTDELRNRLRAEREGVDRQVPVAGHRPWPERTEDLPLAVSGTASQLASMGGEDR